MLHFSQSRAALSLTFRCHSQLWSLEGSKVIDFFSFTAKHHPNQWHILPGQLNFCKKLKTITRIIISKPLINVWSNFRMKLWNFPHNVILNVEILLRASSHFLWILHQSSYLSRISRIIFLEKHLSCGEISDFYKEFEQFMEFYWNLCRSCSKFAWRKSVWRKNGRTCKKHWLVMQTL